MTYPTDDTVQADTGFESVAIPVWLRARRLRGRTMPRDLIL